MSDMYDQGEPGIIVTTGDDYMDVGTLQSIVASEMDDAIDYIDNTISPARAQATKYYNGEPYGDEEDGRSQVVSMDVRDTVHAIMPSLLRIFTGNERAVEYLPRHASDVDAAKQATEYVNYLFNQENNGFLTLHSAFKDALIRKVGVVKFAWDESVEVSASELTGLDDDGLAALLADDTVSVEAVKSVAPQISAEQAQAIEMAGLDMPMIHDVEITRRNDEGRVRIEAIPPEEFLIDRRAKGVGDATMTAHRRIMTVSDLVAMGYDFDTVSSLASDSDSMDMNVERYTRNPARTNDKKTSQDPSQRKISYAEVYIRVDRDGDGIAELRKVCVAGNSHEVLADYPCDMPPFAAFCPDPEAHEFFGNSLADVTMDIQRIKSVVLRNTLDSLAMSIHPRMAVTEGQVSIEDVMNTETGAIIRQRSPGQVQPLSMPFVGKEAFPVLGYLDQTKENRTGISKASAGLDANALQSSTASAVAATVAGAQQQIEMIARIFSETGMRDLMRGVLQLICKHQQRQRIVRLNDKYVPIDPRYWDSTMDVQINTALGRGSDNERLAMLTQIGQMQKEAMSTMGPINPLTDVSKLYNVLSEMTALAGFKDTSKFWSDPANFKPPPQQAKEPDINEQLIAVQIQQIQADTAKKAAELQLAREKMTMEDDRKRDEMEVDLYVKAEEHRAKYGTQIKVEQIKKSAAISRETMKAQADLIKDAVRDPEG